MRLGLVAARKAHGWTQEDLLVRLLNRQPDIKVDRPMISKYERGALDIPGRVLSLLSEILETPMEALYTQVNGTRHEPATAS
jgi:transcriptional regulator with XRE-family HTH domain